MPSALFPGQYVAQCSLRWQLPITSACVQFRCSPVLCCAMLYQFPYKEYPLKFAMDQLRRWYVSCRVDGGATFEACAIVADVSCRLAQRAQRLSAIVRSKCSTTGIYRNSTSGQRKSITSCRIDLPVSLLPSSPVVRSSSVATTSNVMCVFDTQTRGRQIRQIRQMNHLHVGSGRGRASQFLGSDLANHIGWRNRGGAIGGLPLLGQLPFPMLRRATLPEPSMSTGANQAMAMDLPHLTMFRKAPQWETPGRTHQTEEVGGLERQSSQNSTGLISVRTDPG